MPKHSDVNDLRVPIPPGRDPFVNNLLTPLGKDADSEERFWISTWNSNSGTIGVMVTESGRERIYRFPPPHFGFYSAAQEDEDTLWLCGDLSRIVRLTLSSGDYQVYETGAPSALVFAGMIFDGTTKKLYAAAFPPPQTMAFSFDTKTCKTVKIYQDICPEIYPRAAFANGDGTYSSTMLLPGLSLMQWNPLEETLSRIALHEQKPNCQLPLSLHSGVYRTVSDPQNRWYLSGFGWYDPRTNLLSQEEPRPERELAWFKRQDNLVWGISSTGSEKTVVGIWDLNTGAVNDVCELTDCNVHSAAITDSGKIVAVSLYGDFSRYDAHTGTLEISRRLPTDSIGHVDCLRRIDKDRLLGTPFITQRFWEVNLRTGKGFDCGRAAPRSGEVLQTWKIAGKIYMAAYTGGELMEYDPAIHPHFPENPRVVSAPPHAMRPTATADDGRNIYYCCTHEYGELGCVITKYDTVTGENLYRDNPLPGQAICSLAYDGATHSLLAVTTRQADCASATPTADHGYLARIDADSLSVIEQQAMPIGFERGRVIGALSDGNYLCQTIKNSSESNGSPDSIDVWFTVSLKDFRIPDLETMQLFPESLKNVQATSKPGLFIGVSMENQLQLWDWSRQQCLQNLHGMEDAYRYFVDEDSIFLVTKQEIIALEGCLAIYI